MSVKILHGDCLDLLKAMPDESVDSVVTDPPYGIRFMGKAWDGADIEKRAAARRAAASHAPNSGPNGGHKSLAAEAGKYDLTPSAMVAFQEFSEEWAREALRVLKPGGHLLSFASPRTYHRMVCGIEDAGFEVRDCIQWVFGSGFPKSHNLDGEWEGWGTALKPAHEPILLARKPLGGTVATNVLACGTGALNISGCRVPGAKPATTRGAGERDGWRMQAQGRIEDDGAGRWPANLIHDGSEEVLAAFPNAPGQMADASSSSSSSSSRKTQNAYSAMRRGRGNEASAESENDGAVGFRMRPGARRLDAGSAARFFYCAKASKRDRDEGLDSFMEQVTDVLAGHRSRRMDEVRRPDGQEPSRGRNAHPTVKPTDLMRYLCRLITPPGGTVLDPFMGSGSTGKAAMLEGFSFIGIEREAEFVEIARARIAHAVEQIAAAAAECAPAPQLDMFRVVA